jgi:glutathione peroxidase-family protein
MTIYDYPLDKKKGTKVTLEDYKEKELPVENLAKMDKLL